MANVSFLPKDLAPVLTRVWAPVLLSVLRIMTGLLLLQHGTGKILGFPAIAMHEHGAMLYFTGLMELVGGALITIGFLTRPVAFILSGYMAFAYFLAHAPRSFFPAINLGELAALYCFVFVYLAAAGPGPWAIDRDYRGNRTEP
jgi:putative oxidoreductase